MIVADAEQFRSLAGTLAAARAYVAQARGDREATERHARRALDLLPKDDPFFHGIPAVILGLAQWSRGELADARRSFDEALHSYRLAGNIPYQHRATYATRRSCTPREGCPKRRPATSTPSDSSTRARRG